MSDPEKWVHLAMAVQARTGPVFGCLLMFLILLVTYPIWFALELATRHPEEPQRAVVELVEFVIVLFSFAMLLRYSAGFGWPWPFMGG